jgi:DNA repair exonuclease SbcCD ATPase subunit
MIIESSEQKLKQERVDIENGLMEQIKNFEKDIQAIKQEAHQFKERNNAKQLTQNIQELKNIRERLVKLSQEMKGIHEQQADLDMMLGEYPMIDELKQYIKPFEELWAL